MEVMIISTFDKFNHEEFIRLYGDLLTKYNPHKLDLEDEYVESATIIEINSLEELFTLCDDFNEEVIISKFANYKDLFSWESVVFKEDRFKKYLDMWVIEIYNGYRE